jgi:hypothetical protein
MNRDQSPSQGFFEFGVPSGRDQVRLRRLRDGEGRGRTPTLAIGAAFVYTTNNDNDVSETRSANVI